jgi:hypothetical protein
MSVMLRGGRRCLKGDEDVAAVTLASLPPGRLCHDCRRDRRAPDLPDLLGHQVSLGLVSRRDLPCGRALRPRDLLESRQGDDAGSRLVWAAGATALLGAVAAAVARRRGGARPDRREGKLGGE